MAGRLDGKVAMITGAAHGQGRSHAIRLAEEGADIIAVDICEPIATAPYPMEGDGVTDTSTAPVDVTTRMLAAADSDIATFFSLFADDCEFRMGNNEVVRGSQNIQEWVAGFLHAVVGLQHEIREMWSDGDVAAARADVTYTLQDGARLTLPAVTRVRVRDGRACEYTIFMDPGPVVAASAR